MFKIKLMYLRFNYNNCENTKIDFKQIYYRFTYFKGLPTDK